LSLDINQEALQKILDESPTRGKALKELGAMLGIAEAGHFMVFDGRLHVGVVRKDGAYEDHGWKDNLVVTAGLEFVVDAFQNATELENMNFHAVGTTDTTVAAGDTALGAETLMGNANRPAGTQGENGATTYQSQVTITNNSGGQVIVREAGLFSANAAGIMFARQLTGDVTLDDQDSIQTTWEITVS